MHTPHPIPLDPPLVISYRYHTHFSHLAALILFFFTKRQSQKGRTMAQCSPPLKYAPVSKPGVLNFFTVALGPQRNHSRKQSVLLGVTMVGIINFFLPIVPLMEHIFVLKVFVFIQNLEVWFQCKFISLPLLLSSKYIFV